VCESKDMGGGGAMMKVSLILIFSAIFLVLYCVFDMTRKKFWRKG
jgi:hypothetical protein